VDGGGEILAILVFSIVVFGFVCSAIWSGKGGDPFVGFLIGAVLGLIGLVVVAVMTPQQSALPSKRTRECPHCKERMRRDASVCPHCQRDSDPWTFHDGFWWVKRDSGDYYYDETKNEWIRFEPSAQQV
jgi:hypothetical protein